MKKIISRELLLTTKAAQKWDKNFEENVDVLMKIVSTIDTPCQRARSTEILDFYNKKSCRLKGSKSILKQIETRPFEFLVSSN